MNGEIKKIDGYYQVLSPAGKRLGGPYEMYAEAQTRMDQVNRHVAKAKAKEEKK